MNKNTVLFSLTLRISVPEETSAIQISHMEAATHKLMNDLELHGFGFTLSENAVHISRPCFI
jgi:hypothetical protein